MKKRILVIDNESESRESFAHAFEDMDYGVSLVDSGDKGLDIVRSEGCDLAFVDLSLEGVSGAQIVRKLRELSVDLPIFVMTTAREASLHELDQVRREGIPFHLVRKPIGQIEIQAFCHSVLGQAL